MESSHLVIFSTPGNHEIQCFTFICLSETLFWTGARGRITITLTENNREGRLVYK